jgi:hypothetical protein
LGIKLKEKVNVWISGKNVSKYMNKVFIVQDIQEVNGKYGSALVAKLYSDGTMYNLRLGQTAIRKLIEDGFDDTSQLIGMKVKLATVPTISGNAIVLEMIDNGNK